MLARLLALACAAVPVAARAQCELHVWPSDGMSAVRQRGSESTGAGGSGGGGLLGAALAGAISGAIKSAEAKAAEKRDASTAKTLAAKSDQALPAQRQAALLAAQPLPAMLGLPGYSLVVHDTPLDSRTIRTVKTRYVESVAPCYADLVLDDVVYSREYARGRNLKTFFRFRDFGPNAAPGRSFGTWVETKLLVFSIDPPEFGPAAREEIAEALRGNLVKFSELATRRPRPKT